MRGLWLDSPEATCVHPGWHTIRGYADIQKSWAAIFINQGPIRIWPSDEHVAFRDDLAVVACLENIDVSATTTGRIVRAKAVNTFRETRRGWKMLHHHAESLPKQEVWPSNERLAKN